MQNAFLNQARCHHHHCCSSDYAITRMACSNSPIAFNLAHAWDENIQEGEEIMRIGGSAIFFGGVVVMMAVYGALFAINADLTWRDDGIGLEFDARLKREEFLDVESPESATAQRTDEPFSDVPIASQPVPQQPRVAPTRCDRIPGIPYFNLSNSSVKQKDGVTVHEILHRQVVESPGVQVLQIEVPPAFSGATAQVGSSASKTVFSQTALHGRGDNPTVKSLCELLSDRGNETTVTLPQGDLFAYLIINKPESVRFSLEVEKPVPSESRQELLPYEAQPNSTLAEVTPEPPPAIPPPRQIDKSKQHLPIKPINFVTGQTGTSFSEWIAGNEILQRSLNVREGQRVQVSTSGYAFWLDEEKRAIQSGTEFDFELPSGGTHYLLIEARGREGATLTTNVVITN